MQDFFNKKRIGKPQTKKFSSQKYQIVGPLLVCHQDENNDQQNCDHSANRKTMVKTFLVLLQPRIIY